MADSTNGVNGRSAPNGRASYAERHQIADHFIGGNRLSNAPSSKVKDFVAENDGHTVITNVSFPSSVIGSRAQHDCQC
jgi:acetyl-CoA carboxylase/biotin carboxylase 1